MNFTRARPCCQNATEPGVSILHRAFTGAGRTGFSVRRACRQHRRFPVTRDFACREERRVASSCPERLRATMNCRLCVLGGRCWNAETQLSSNYRFCGLRGRRVRAKGVFCAEGAKVFSRKAVSGATSMVLGQRFYEQAARRTFFSAFCALLSRLDGFWATPLMLGKAQHQKCCPKPGDSGWVSGGAARRTVTRAPRSAPRAGARPRRGPRRRGRGAWPAPGHRP